MRTRNSNTRVQNASKEKPVNNNNKRTSKRVKKSDLRSSYDERYGIESVANAFAFIMDGKECGEVILKVTPKVVCIEGEGSLWAYRPRVAYIADSQSGIWDKENGRYKIARESWNAAKAAWEKAGKPEATGVEREVAESKPTSNRSRSNAQDGMLSSSVILSAFDKFVEAQNAANDAFKKALLDAAGVKPRTSGNTRASRSTSSRRRAK